MSSPKRELSPRSSSSGSRALPLLPLAASRPHGARRPTASLAARHGDQSDAAVVQVARPTALRVDLSLRRVARVLVDARGRNIERLVFLGSAVVIDAACARFRSRTQNVRRAPEVLNRLGERGERRVCGRRVERSETLEVAEHRRLDAHGLAVETELA